MSTLSSMLGTPDSGVTVLFSTRGRFRRRQFLSAVLGVVPVGWQAAERLLGMLSHGVPAGHLADFVFSLLALIAMLVVGAASAVKRMHDMGRSAWWVCFYLVPLFQLALLLWQLLARGQDEPNEHGATSLGNWPWSRSSTERDEGAGTREPREPARPRRTVRLDIAGRPSVHRALDHPILLGRSRRCDVVLDGDALISAKHARLSQRGDALLLEDLVSINGTRLNGRPVRDAQRVADGDVLTLGNTSIRIHA